MSTTATSVTAAQNGSPHAQASHAICARRGALAALIEPDPTRQIALALALREALQAGRLALDPAAALQPPPGARQLCSSVLDTAGVRFETCPDRGGRAGRLSSVSGACVP
ncbi:hypothetical protein THIX_60208 [Thiomonas sp. X19]|nr:hypothetical protein THIX_60208 [Thiomonas sp. X19]